MNFESPAPRRDHGEPVAPLINVVFLLLIFFLMAATLAPPDPLEATPPTSTSGEPVSAPQTLAMDAAGALAFGDARGEAAFAAIAAQLREDPEFRVLLRVDRRASAASAAEVLRRVRALGARDAALLVTP